MRTVTFLLALLTFNTIAQSERLDTATYNQLVLDLKHADTPYECPSIEALVVERKFKKNSVYPKKEEIKMLNGRTVAKYEYTVENGILISRRLKGQSMVRGTWLTADYYYTDSGKVLSMVEYKLYENDNLGQSDVTEKTKTIKNNLATTSSTNSYTLVAPPPPVVNVFEPSTPTTNNSNTIAVSCDNYYHWFNQSYTRLEQRFNSNNQLRERIFFDDYNRILGTIRYHYYNGLLSRVELLDSYNNVQKEELITYDNNGNVVSRQRLK